MYQEESDLLKASLCFPIKPGKNQNSEILFTFEKIHHLFIMNLKSNETKNQVKVHLSYLPKSSFYNYKLQRILRKHLTQNKDFVITKPNKGNGVLILDRILYSIAIASK